MTTPKVNEVLEAIRRAAAHGDFAQVVAQAPAVLAQNPEDVRVHFYLGTALMNANRVKEALVKANEVLDLTGPTQEALDFKLACLISLRRGKQAQRLTTLYPGADNQQLAAARVANNFGRPAEALEQMESFLKLKPAHPLALHYKGRSLILLDRYEDALEVYQSLITAHPADNTYAYNFAVSLMNLGRFDEALVYFHNIAEMPARPAHAVFNRGLCRLAQGDLINGLVDFAVRWKLPDKYIRRYVTPKIPQWQGEALTGKRIVAFGEQGLGDALQFVRFLPDLKKQGAEVTLCSRTELHAILGDAYPDIPIISEVGEGAASAFDFQVSLFDIPRFLKTPLEAVWQAPYLTARSERIEHWDAKLPKNGWRVAINWMGRPTYRVNHLRSPALAEFAPLAALPGVELISVQKVNGLDQLQDLPPGMHVHSLEGLDDTAGEAFLDTAAVLKACDLVITSDTALAHLAGALGVRCWLALPFVADWRWLLDRSDSPWYPSLRLYRQPSHGAWKDVFGAMALDLQSEL